jgi:hypothetical protein
MKVTDRFLEHFLLQVYTESLQDSEDLCRGVLGYDTECSVQNTSVCRPEECLPPKLW